jgi:hypothetical protein
VTLLIPNAGEPYEMEVHGISAYQRSVLRTDHGDYHSKEEFMISPNLPRFVRQGDHCVFSAKITNLSDAGTNGIAIIELADAENDKNPHQKRD